MTEHPRLDEIVEKSEAKFLSRYAVPVLVFLLLTVGGFAFRAIVGRLDTIDNDNKKRADDIATIKSDVRVLNTRLDGQVIEQVGDNKNRLDDHEARIQRIERVVHIP